MSSQHRTIMKLSMCTFNVFLYLVVNTILTTSKVFLVTVTNTAGLFDVRICTLIVLNVIIKVAMFPN